MLNDLLYFFGRWRRRCKLIRIIEKVSPADSSYNTNGIKIVKEIGGDINIDWRDLPLEKLESYAKRCVLNNESLSIKYQNGKI